MKILLIRHAEPDYSIDSLTPEGWKEAEALGQRLAKRDIKTYYVSPMGRAKDTASFALALSKKEPVIQEWLREFGDHKIRRPDHPDKPGICWDWLPQDWTKDPRAFDKDHWGELPEMAEADIALHAKEVTDAFDSVLEQHGYKRQGPLYVTNQGNNDTIAFVCHLGVMSVILAHLLNVSPMIIWHNCCCLPSSVTELVTEERRKGIASFRMLAFGDTSHLYAAGLEPSFYARFRECYENEDQRKDN